MENKNLYQTDGFRMVHGFSNQTQVDSTLTCPDDPFQNLPICTNFDHQNTLVWKLKV